VFIVDNDVNVDNDDGIVWTLCWFFFFKTILVVSSSLVPSTITEAATVPAAVAPTTVVLSLLAHDILTITEPSLSACWRM
jgi:hypothetical protein